MMEYHFSKTVHLSFDEAVDKVIDELKKEGLGIISRINMQETLKEKINVDFRKYLILGACKPHYAYEAIQQESKMGLFLPCNIVVQEHNNGEVEISVVNPEKLMHNIENLRLESFAKEVRESLQRVLINC